MGVFSPYHGTFLDRQHREALDSLNELHPRVKDTLDLVYTYKHDENVEYDPRPYFNINNVFRDLQQYKILKKMVGITR